MTGFDWIAIALVVVVLLGLGLGPRVGRWRRDRAAARRRAELRMVKFPGDDPPPSGWGR